MQAGVDQPCWHFPFFVALCFFSFFGSCLLRSYELRVREHASVVFWFRFLLLLLAIQFFANLDRLFVSENICETHFCRWENFNCFVENVR